MMCFYRLRRARMSWIMAFHWMRWYRPVASRFVFIKNWTSINGHFPFLWTFNSLIKCCCWIEWMVFGLKGRLMTVQVLILQIANVNAKSLAGSQCGTTSGCIVTGGTHWKWLKEFYCDFIDRSTQRGGRGHLQTVFPVKSACNCINKLLIVNGPSALIFIICTAQSSSIACKMSLVWKQMASNAARMMWLFVVKAVNPQIILKEKRIRY